MKHLLFVCTHNAGRSQIAQAFWDKHGPDDIRAESAGQDPTTEPWPEVVQAMAEVDIDISRHRPQKLTIEMQLHADWARSHSPPGRRDPPLRRPRTQPLRRRARPLIRHDPRPPQHPKLPPRGPLRNRDRSLTTLARRRPADPTWRLRV
jgi:predicted protein tyrosine phosphatase